MTDALLYARQSLGDASVDQQLELAAKRATERGWTVVERFHDRSVSASTGVPRPGYDAMIEAVKSGRADVIVVRHFDRLYRQPRELEDVIDATEGVHVEAVYGGGHDLSSADGRTHARVIGAFARGEADKKSERQRDAAQRDAAAGKARLATPRPFGFADDHVTHRPDEAAAVAWAVESLLGGGTVSAVTREWTRRGLRPSQAPYGPLPRQPWKRNSVTSVLKNARIAGLRSYRGEVVGAAEWAPIVPEEQWRAIVALLDDPARKVSHGVRTLLGGLARCQCGNTLQGAINATGKHVYRCNPETRIPGTTGHCQQMIAGVDAEVIWRVINALAGEGRDELITPKRPDLSPLRAQAAAIRRNLNELAADRAEGLIDRAQMIAATQRGNRRLDEINAELAAAAAVSALAPFATLGDLPVGDMIDATQARIDAAQTVWDGLDDSRKRAVIEATFPRVIVLPAGRGARVFDPAKVLTC